MDCPGARGHDECGTSAPEVSMHPPSVGNRELPPTRGQALTLKSSDGNEQKRILSRCSPLLSRRQYCRAEKLKKARKIECHEVKEERGLPSARSCAVAYLLSRPCGEVGHTAPSLPYFGGRYAVYSSEGPPFLIRLGLFVPVTRGKRMTQEE